MTDPLTIYLHDHLAGSNFAVDLLESWRADYADEDLGILADKLLQEIESDRTELRQIIARTGAPPHSFKEVVAWVAEKASRFKLRHEAVQALGIFEGLEMLTLGILGKLGLWKALAVIAASDPRLAGTDFARLMARAKEQHELVEAHRIRMAATVFAR